MEANRRISEVSKLLKPQGQSNHIVTTNFHRRTVSLRFHLRTSQQRCSHYNFTIGYSSWSPDQTKRISNSTNGNKCSHLPLARYVTQGRIAPGCHLGSQKIQPPHTSPSESDSTLHNFTEGIFRDNPRISEFFVLSGGSTRTSGCLRLVRGVWRDGGITLQQNGQAFKLTPSAVFLL